MGALIQTLTTEKGDYPTPIELCDAATQRENYSGKELSIIKASQWISKCKEAKSITVPKKKRGERKPMGGLRMKLAMLDKVLNKGKKLEAQPTDEMNEEDVEAKKRLQKEAKKEMKR